MTKRYQADTDNASREVILRRVQRVTHIPVPVPMLRSQKLNGAAIRTWCWLWAISGDDPNGGRTTYRNKKAIAETIGIGFSTFKGHMALLRAEGWLYDEPLDPRNPCSPTQVYVLEKQHKPDQGELFAGQFSGSTGPGIQPSTGPGFWPLGEYPLEGTHASRATSQQAGRGPSPWDEIFEEYPGRKKAKAARGKFFKLLKVAGLGARDVQQRVRDFVAAYERLGWPLPELTHLLDPDRENLTDPQLAGLQHEAAKATGKPDPAQAAKRAAQRSTDELRRLQAQATGLQAAVADGNTRAAKQLEVVLRKINQLQST